MRVLSTNPTSGQVAVFNNLPIVITFDKNVDKETVSEATVLITTSKPGVIKVKNQLEQPSDIFDSESFFSDDYTAIVKSSIIIDNNTITFKPKTSLLPNTKYTVTISEHIAGLDGSTLGKMHYFSFKTASEDLARDPLPQEIGELQTIIGKNVYLEGQPAQTGFRVIKSSPDKSSLFVRGTKVSITLSDDLKLDQTGMVSVFYSEIFSDFPGEEVDAADYTVTINGKTITVELVKDSLKPNCYYEVIFNGVESASGAKLTESYSVDYLSELTPYYSSTKLIKLKGGSVLTGVSDITMAMMIHCASVEADQYLSKTRLSYPDQMALKKHYASNATLEYILSTNFSGVINDFVSKKLGEFSISVASKTKINLYNSLVKELKDWKQSFFDYITSFNGVVPRQPAKYDIGRSWIKGGNSHLSHKVFDGKFYTWTNFDEANRL
jgi:hypothetical protein